MDTSNTRSSINDSLQLPDNDSPDFSEISTAASPKVESQAYRPLPPLPTNLVGDEIANKESEVDDDDEPRLFDASSVPDDEKSLVIFSSAYSDEFCRYHPPQFEALRATRSEEGLGTATFDTATPQIEIGNTDASVDHDSNTDNSISAPTPARGRPLPKVPGGRPLPPIPAKRPLPATPGAIKSVDNSILEALTRNITNLRQSLRDATKRTTNLHALSQIKDSLLQAQAEMIEAQGEILTRYRAAAEQGKRDK